jgi:hypothetical protein
MQALREMAVEAGAVRPELKDEVAELDRWIQTLRRDLVNLLVTEPERYLAGRRRMEEPAP